MTDVMDLASTDGAAPSATALPTIAPVVHAGGGEGVEQGDAPSDVVCADAGADQAVADSSGAAAEADAGSRADSASCMAPKAADEKLAKVTYRCVCVCVCVSGY